MPVNGVTGREARLLHVHVGHRWWRKASLTLPAV
jgi:hypothetical protein